MQSESLPKPASNPRMQTARWGKPGRCVCPRGSKEVLVSTKSSRNPTPRPRRKAAGAEAKKHALSASQQSPIFTNRSRPTLN